MDHQKRISDELWNGDTYDERIPDSDAEDLITSRLYSRAKWGMMPFIVIDKNAVKRRHHCSNFRGISDKRYLK